MAYICRISPEDAQSFSGIRNNFRRGLITYDEAVTEAQRLMVDIIWEIAWDCKMSIDAANDVLRFFADIPEKIIGGFNLTAVQYDGTISINGVWEE